MMHLYINYPEAHYTIHWDPTCSEIGKHHKPAQRRYTVDINSLAKRLAEFSSATHAFGSDQSKNDMWLAVTLQTAAQESEFVETLRAAIGQHYDRLGAAPIITHCQAVSP